MENFIYTLIISQNSKFQINFFERPLRSILFLEGDNFIDEKPITSENIIHFAPPCALDKIIYIYPPT